MKSLLLRIFLWVWLTMAVVGAALVITSPFFTGSRPGLERWQRDAQRQTGRLMDAMSRRIAHAEADDLQGMRPQREHRGGPPDRGPRMYLFDPDGRELFGHVPPDEVVEIVRETRETGEGLSVRRGARYLQSRPVTDRNGMPLVAVAEVRSPPPMIHLLEPGALAWRLAVILVVVGALSWWLAWSLSSPVPPLRRAARALSGGNLGARVEDRVVRRRDELGELARDFNRMAERIEELLGSQRRLLRDVSHELRSPLARMQVALELARTGGGEAVSAPMDRIQREVGRLDALIAQLLLLERLRGGTPLEIGDLDVVRILAQVVDDAAFEAAAQGVQVRFVGGEPCRIRGEGELLHRSFDNFLRNAVHHSPEGGIVDVNLRAGRGTVEITVADQGPGVPDEHLERIFEPFHRVQEARDRVSGGTGLGLAIGARAVDAHGGSIKASNRDGGGLEIRVVLPLGPRQNDSESAV